MQSKLGVTIDMFNIHNIPPVFQNSRAGGVSLPTLPLPSCALRNICCAICMSATRTFEMIDCSSCNKSFHRNCVPPSASASIDTWYCPDCMVEAAVIALDVLPSADVSYKCFKCGKQLNSAVALNYHCKKDVCTRKNEKRKREDEMKIQKQLIEAERVAGKKETQRRKLAAKVDVTKIVNEESSKNDRSDEDQKVDNDSSGINIVENNKALSWLVGRTRSRWQQAASKIALAELENLQLMSDEVLATLQTDMWNFKDSISLEMWIKDYLNSYSVISDDGTLVSSIDIWPLRAVDVGTGDSPIEYETFEVLDDRIRFANHSSNTLIEPFSALFSPTDSSYNLMKYSTNILHHQPKQLEDKNDFFINAGGPVWSIAFAPICAGYSDLETRYFSVGVSRIGFINDKNPLAKANRAAMVEGMLGPGYDVPHDMNNPQIHDNLLQIWSSKIDQFRSEDSKVELAYAVSLKNHGAVFQTMWHPSCKLASTDSIGLLGILCVVCGDGNCLILILPTQARMRHLNFGSDTSRPNSYIPVLPEHSVCRYQIRLLDSADRILCASWATSSDMKLCCGHLDGSVSVWKIDANQVRSTSQNKNSFSNEENYNLQDSHKSYNYGKVPI
jgi:hypothetical protein